MIDLVLKVESAEHMKMSENQKKGGVAAQL